MIEAKIRDYERGKVVGIVKRGGVQTQDQLLTEEMEDISMEGGDIPIIYPGGEAGTYMSSVASPGEEGYVLAVVNKLPSPFDIDDRSRLKDLPSWTPTERSEDEENEDVSKEWVEDPSPNAQNTRWRNTETDEYRYQESKPGSGHSGGGGGGGDVDVSEVDTDYDIDSNFGAEVAQAMEENDGDPVGTIRANEWMSNAGSIDDADLLLDALEPIQDHGTKTARDRVRRRLRGMGWEPDEIDEALSEGEEQDEEQGGEPESQSPHEEWQEEYESATVEKTMTLSEAGADTGVNAHIMEVEQLEDGTEVYRMGTAPHSNSAGDVRNQQAAYAALRVMDAGVPPQMAGEDGEEVWYAMKETEGETVWSAPGSWHDEVEREDYVEEMAKQLIVGNSDCHGENIAITEEGDIEVFDLDHSTGKLDSDPAYWGQSIGSKALQQFYASAGATGVDDSGIEDDILGRARELARGMKESGQVEEIKDAITEVESKGREDKIEYNINLLAEGGDINL